MKKKWIYIIAAIVAVGIIGKVAGGKDEKTEPTIVATEKVEKVTKGIPGSNPIDITTNLDERGFKIDKQFDKDAKFWYCTKSENGIDYNVTVYSTNITAIEEIKISASINGKESKNIIATKPLISYIATFPYTNSNPEEVANWIDANFDNDGATTVVSGVRFSMHGSSPFSRLIKIEKAE